MDNLETGYDGLPNEVESATEERVCVKRMVMPVKPHNYAVVQRLRFIDFLLAQFGYVNRSHIQDYFGISIPQATTDMKNYIKLVPDNMRYSNKQKRYIRTSDFERVWA